MIQIIGNGIWYDDKWNTMSVVFGSFIARIRVNPRYYSLLLVAELTLSAFVVKD